MTSGSGHVLAVQADLISGESRMTCWLAPDIKVGDVITLKNSDDPEREWAVKAIYKQGTPPDRGWKVGGL